VQADDPLDHCNTPSSAGTPYDSEVDASEDEDIPTERQLRGEQKAGKLRLDRPKLVHLCWQQSSSSGSV
jgi:hypothetical protein